MRMNCFDRRTLMVLSLTLSSGFSKSSAIVRPAEPALSWITLRLESFASYIHASYAGQESESCINKIRKIYENLLNKKIYPQVILFPRAELRRQVEEARFAHLRAAPMACCGVLVVVSYA